MAGRSIRSNGHRRAVGAVLDDLPAHVPKKVCPDLIRGGLRFSDKEMRKIKRGRAPCSNWQTNSGSPART
jgi:hypothetical protein